MMKKQTAIEIQQHALTSIIELTTILLNFKDRCSDAEYEVLKRGVGLSIGKIQMELLEFINHLYPDIDDLKE